MKDLSGLMKQAQAMQQKMTAAQAELEQLVLLGQAGDGLVKVTLRGTGQITRVDIDESLMAPGEAHYIVNASRTDPAQLLVILVTKAGTKTLTEPLPK